MTETPVTPPYDLSDARAWCEAAGLKWDEATAADAERLFDELALTEYQANSLAIFYAHRVAWLFNPPTYGVWQRIGIALHFLFGRALPPFKESR